MGGWKNLISVSMTRQEQANCALKAWREVKMTKYDATWWRLWCFKSRRSNKQC